MKWNSLKVAVILLALVLCGVGVETKAQAKKGFDVGDALLKSYYLIEQKQYKKADALLDKILEQDPGNPLALNNKASVMVYEKKFDKAENYLNQALLNAKGYRVQVNRVCYVGNICLALKPVASGTGNQDLEPMIKMNIEMVKGYMATTRPSDQIPQFPWPPPKPSAFADIPQRLLLKSDGHTLLKDVAERLRAAFEQGGYGEKSWYQFPDGFALVSRMEQINSDGSPKEGEVRWIPNVDNPPIFSLGSYLKALFTASKGHYRVIVFVVTDKIFSPSPQTASPEEARAWLNRGCMELPPEIGAHPYTKNHYCKALIYEFEQEDNNPIPKIPSDLQGEDHLKKSKLWSALGGEV